MKLRFTFGNSKLINSIATFALPAGHSCPFAKECFSKASKLTGKVIDGAHCRFRCFAATEERYPAVRAMRWQNFEMVKSLRSVEKIAELINNSLPDTRLVRIHPSGDFFSEKYFLAWLNVACNYPLTTFYAYTKALPFWVKYRSWLPDNFKLVASRGGTHDNLIGRYHLRSAKVVFSEQEAEDMGLEIDHTDSLAYAGKSDFALLLHGTQPVGTEAGKAWYKIMKAGKGYSPKSKAKMNPQELLKIHVTIKQGEIRLPMARETDTLQKIYDHTS
jgi:hypothetical protein